MQSNNNKSKRNQSNNNLQDIHLYSSSLAVKNQLKLKQSSKQSSSVIHLRKISKTISKIAMFFGK